jgi:hypothetical protein
MPLLERVDPRLRSGNVLAGANHQEASAESDGRLTALDATREGVYGLQRSLRVAGERTTLLTLWEVDDETTKAFMVKYTKLLKQGVGLAQALRQGQDLIRGNARWSHPHVWAAWQLSGDGGALPMGDRLPR